MQPGAHSGDLTADIDHLVHAINEVESTSFRMVGSLAGGATGAYALEPGPCVLKIRRGNMAWWVRRGQITVDSLRAVGYPAPEFLHIGEIDETTFWITERLPGTPMAEALTWDTLPLLLELVDRTADVRPATGQDWSVAMKKVPLDDEFGWCELISSQSADAARLIDELQAVIEPLRDANIPNDDAVHGDFGPHNVLVDKGRVTAVVDCEAPGRGTRIYDLAHLRRWATSERMHDELEGRAVAIAGVGPYALFTAYRLLDGLAWTLHKDPPASPRAVGGSWGELDRIRSVLS